MERTMSTKWKWGAVALILIAAAVIGVRWCASHKDGDQTGGKDDAHARLCAKRHPPFPRLKVPGQSIPRGPKTAGQPAAPRPAAAATVARKTEEGAAPPVAAQSLMSAEAAALSSDALAGVTGNCPPDLCGFNGTWLGSGVPFRTLHLSPYRHNEANLSLLGALGPADKHGHRDSLALQIDDDRLHAANQRILESGSILRLGHAEIPGGPPSHATYELTITKVDETLPFLVDCADCTRKTYPLYEFTARSLDDDCPLQVCAPGLDDGSDAANNLIGNAVIYQGDFYEPGYKVRTSAATGYDDDTFNIACVGTALSKLHVLRHTSASQGAPGDHLPPPVDKRQALLRMLTADYCGAGHPFTHDGVPLHFGIDLGAGYDGLLNPGPLPPPPPGPNAGISIPAWTHFALDPTSGLGTVDALWTGDGATCIGTPRLLATDPGLSTALWARIEAVCRSVNHPVRHCDVDAPSLGASYAPPLPLQSYAISQIGTP
jgi:hypothetical protein